MDSFCEGIYDVLDPARKGYVDLQKAQLSLSQFSPAVITFVRRVLDTCELDIEPSQIAFKEDIMTRLMMAVDEEWRSLKAETPTFVSVETSPVVNTVPQELPAMLPPPAKQADPFLSRVYMQRKEHNSMLDHLKTESISKELKECTFTPTITKRASTGGLPISARPRNRMDAGTSTDDDHLPHSGLRLKVISETSFKQSLRNNVTETSERLSQTKTKSTHSRAFLMHRVNEADRFWNLSYNS